MTYGELALKWIHRILIIMLFAAICGIAITAIARAQESGRTIDAQLSRIDSVLAKNWIGNDNPYR